MSENTDTAVVTQKEGDDVVEDSLINVDNKTMSTQQKLMK